MMPLGIHRGRGEFADGVNFSAGERDGFGNACIDRVHAFVRCEMKPIGFGQQNPNRKQTGMADARDLIGIQANCTQRT